MECKVTVKNGEVILDVEGVKGPGCKGITDAIAAAAGATVVKEDPKDDYYAQASTDATQSEGT